MTQTSIRYVPEQDRYCLAWRTPIMPASSFWYFATREEAEQAQAQMAVPECGTVWLAYYTVDGAKCAMLTDDRDCIPPDATEVSVYAGSSTASLLRYSVRGMEALGYLVTIDTSVLHYETPEPTPTPGAPLAAPTVERHEWTESGPRHRVYAIQEVTVVNGQRIGRTLESGIVPGCPCAICTPPELPAYNPEDGAPCAQCGHGQELHVNGTEDCWESTDATPATFCPCPRFQAREAAQRADEAAWLPMAGGSGELPVCPRCRLPFCCCPPTSMACVDGDCGICTMQGCVCGCHTAGTPEGDAARWLANRGLPPMAGGSEDDTVSFPYGAQRHLAGRRLLCRAGHRLDSHTPPGTLIEPPRDDAAITICRCSRLVDGSCMNLWPGHPAYGTCHCACHATPLAGGAPTEHTHPCPTCRVARPCTGTGCADGPRECATCSNCRGW